MDTNAFKRRLEGLRVLASDERLAGRDELRGLRDYLRFRDLVVAELDKRETKTLDSVANTDLAQTWDAIVGKLTEGNLSFGDLYFRYLEADRLEVR